LLYSVGKINKLSVVVNGELKLVTTKSFKDFVLEGYCVRSGDPPTAGAAAVLDVG